MARYVFIYEADLDTGDLAPEMFVRYLRETIPSENGSGVADGEASVWEIFTDSIKLVDVQLKKEEK